LVERRAGFFVMVNEWLSPLPPKLRVCTDAAATRAFMSARRDARAAWAGRLVEIA